MALVGDVGRVLARLSNLGGLSWDDCAVPAGLSMAELDAAERSLAADPLRRPARLYGVDLEERCRANVAPVDEATAATVVLPHGPYQVVAGVDALPPLAQQLLASPGGALDTGTPAVGAEAA